MESSYNCLKSLKDTLLEYVVLNVDLAFPPRKLKNDIASVPTFPSYLFEEILDKSKDMCWSISQFDLMPCIAVRERLRWDDTSCLRFTNHFMPDDLAWLDTGKLETLKVSIYLDNQTAVRFFKEISKMSEILDDLHVKVHPRCRHLSSKEVKVGECNLLKVKRLRLELGELLFECFPFTLDPDRLTVFDLFHCFLTAFFLRTLAGFKRLVHLSLCYSMLKEGVSMSQAIDTVASLKGLRILNLCMTGSSAVERDLNRITKDLENLEILEFLTIVLDEPSLLLNPKRKLKVLNCLQIFPTSPTGEALAALNGLSQRVGHFESLDGLVTIVSSTPTYYIYDEAVVEMFSMRVDPKVLIEAETNGNFNFRSPLRLDEVLVHSGADRRNAYDAPTRMACYLVKYFNPLTSLYLREWMETFLVHNGNTLLANKLRKLLRSMDYS